MRAFQVNNTYKHGNTLGLLPFPPVWPRFPHFYLCMPCARWLVCLVPDRTDAGSAVVIRPALPAEFIPATAGRLGAGHVVAALVLLDRCVVAWA